MGKLDSNKKKKETSLLDTAFELFTTKGLTKTSISDIVSKAGVAKGTFYLYFKDKYDLRNHLISHKSSQMFRKAIVQMKVEKKEHDFESDKNALTTKASEKDVDFADVYNMIIENAPNTVKDPEIMVYMIIELVSSTCYSAILYSEPCDMQTLKPYLYGSIKHILHDHIEY